MKLKRAGRYMPARTFSVRRDKDMFDSETLFNLGKDRMRFSEKQEAIYDYFRNERYTYKDLDTRSDKLAWFLTNKLGLAKGDRIGFCASNSVAFFDAYFSTYKTGIIITTYNCCLRAKELMVMIENESPKVIFYTSEFDEKIKALRENGFPQEFICIDKAGEADRYSYHQIMESIDFESPAMPGLDFEDIQMLIHTGGTTGQPKAAMLSFRSLFFNAISGITLFQLSESDCAILTLPLFHTAGWNVFTLPLLMIGGRIIIMSRFDSKSALKIIREEKPTVGIAVETIYKAMSLHSDFAGTNFDCCRYLITGAAPTGKALLETYWAKGVKILNAYGMTEIGPHNCCPPISSMSIEDVRKKWNSCGIPCPFNEMRIVNSDGNDVPPGEKGELIFRGKLLFSGYWNNPEASKAILEDGWVHTGDIGYLDKDGFCYISGRMKNMYISGGENIFPQEVEDVIMTLPGVIEVCVLGVPDKKWGEVGRALIVKAPGAQVTRDAVIEKVKAELSNIKIPKYVTFADAVPKNALGKRDLKEIKRLYGRGEE